MNVFAQTAQSAKVQIVCTCQDQLAGRPCSIKPPPTERSVSNAQS